MEPIVEEIFDLVKVKMIEQAAYDRDAYAALVDETIEYFREKGEINDDDNDEFIKDQLLEKWEWVQEHLKNREE